MTSDDLNVLGLAGRAVNSVRFGDVDAAYAVRGGTTRSAINEMPETEMQLDPTLLAGQPVDYLAPVSFDRIDEGRTTRLFSGSVIDATPSGGLVDVRCQTNPRLQEREVGPFISLHADAREVVHLMARSGGLREDQIRIEGLDTLPLETIEVMAPITGVSITERVHLAGVLFVGSEQVRRIWEPICRGLPQPSPFAEAEVCAVVYESARRLLDAETLGLARIDAALDWLTVRPRYGLATLPDGRPQRFRRSHAVAEASRPDLVLARGLRSRRTWVRLPSGGAASVTPVLNDIANWREPKGPLPLAERQAILALADAARTQDPLRRVQALWEAIEFYVGSSKPPRMFERADVKRARKAALSADLPEGLRERIGDLFAKVNDPPLLARLRYTIQTEGVPITNGEMNLLTELRGRRNDAVHGRLADIPDADDIDHAVSVVARMVVYRLYGVDRVLQPAVAMHEEASRASQ